MDIRLTNPQLAKRKQLQNITNMSVYNLTKRKSLYNELTFQFNKQALIAVKKIPFFTVYTFKVPIYAAFAFLYTLNIRKIKLAHVFIHFTIINLINQYDLNQGIKMVDEKKWEEYDQARKNYQLALSLENVNIFSYVKNKLLSQVSVKDYMSLLELRPY